MAKKISLVILLKISVWLNLLTFLALILHFILNPSYSEIEEIFDRRIKILEEKVIILKNNLDMLGDAQLDGFQEFHEVRESIEKNRLVGRYSLILFEQMVKDEGLKNRQAIKKLHKLIKEVDSNIKDSTEKINSNIGKNK